MKEYKNGVITEEALEKVAGGLNLDKKTFGALCATAGILVAGSVGVGKYLENKERKKLEENGIAPYTV